VVGVAAVVTGGTVEVSGAYVAVVEVADVSTIGGVGNVVVVVPVTAAVPPAAVDVVSLVVIFFSFRRRGGGVFIIGSVVDVSVADAVVSVVAVDDVAVCVCAKRLEATSNRRAAKEDVRISEPPFAARAKQGSSRQRNLERLVIPARDPEPDFEVFSADASGDSFHKTPQTAEAMTT
jgi:hypothetical protein